MIDSSQFFFYLSSRVPALKHPDVMEMVTWCVGSVGATITGDILIINKNKPYKKKYIYHIYLGFGSRVHNSQWRLFVPVCLVHMSPVGGVHSVTARKVLLVRTLPCVKVRRWQSLVQAAETVSVEHVCATTQISLKDPTVSTTRPNVQDLEASSALVWHHMGVYGYNVFITSTVKISNPSTLHTPLTVTYCLFVVLMRILLA